MIYFVIIFIILTALVVFLIVPKILKIVTDLEEKTMRQKLKDNNESNKYGILITTIVLLIFLIIALAS
tara:strand:+ start:60 stop:263 length:204 start_codon:yes stop_codon:yes gene_type:complete